MLLRSLLAVAFSVSLPLIAQDLPTGVPTVFELRIPPGGWIDLDSGTVLPGAEAGRARADLRFDRDGLGFYVQCAAGGQNAGATAEAPDDEGGAWSDERLRFPDARDRTVAGRFFARTERGVVARFDLEVHDPYSVASATLRWVLAPPGQATFGAGPEDVRPEWEDGALVVKWDAGDADRWLVEIDDRNGPPRKRTVGEPLVSVSDADPARRYSVRVWALAAGGEMSVPTEIVCAGARSPAAFGSVEFGDRWYDAAGGLALSRADVASEDAEVVFYLYGVYAPGGGVQRVGRGEAAYHALQSLPADGYRPIHGRLDEGDVFAVRLADGSHGKFWLEPLDGSDLRSGMRVAFTWLADGRRAWLRPPKGVEFDRQAASLQWEAVEGAKGYRLRLEGMAQPVELDAPRWQGQGLTADRFHRGTLQTVGEDETSDAVPIEFHTFGEGYRLGSVQIDATGQRGLSLTDEDGAVAKDADALELRVTNSAGGASYLAFEAPFGIGPAPQGGFGAPPADAPETKAWASDDRNAGSDVFVLGTRDGGVAMVRIVGRDYPVVRIDYVLRLPD